MTKKLSVFILAITIAVVCQISDKTIRVNAKTDVTYSITAESGLSCGDIFDLTVQVVNGSQTAAESRTLTLWAPSFIGLLEDKTLEFGEIAANGSEQKTIKALALEGGSENIYLLDEQDEEVASSEIRVSGRGYYGGDCHTHSVYSDGSGTVTENALSSMDKGLDYVVATDHSKLIQKTEVNYFNKNNENASNFVCVLGDEISMSAHGIAYDISKDPTSISVNNWETASQEVLKQGGFVYYAHPFFQGFLYTDYDLYDITTNFHGVEVVNGNWYEEAPNLQAKDYWDKINTRGEKHYYGLSNTDGHIASIIGSWYNKGVLNALTQENVINMLYSGKFYGTNGTDIRFEMGGKGMGETLHIDEKTDVNLHIEASNRFCNLTHIAVYGFKINGTTEVEKTVVFESDLTGRFFSKNIQLQIVPGYFYRMEVLSERSAATNVTGFAFSNPIWVESAPVSNAVTYGAYQCNSLVYNDWNGKFINYGFTENFSDSEFTVQGGTSSTVTYTEGGNSRAGILSVVYTAADGSTVTDNIYVVDGASLAEKTEPDTPDEPDVPDTPDTPDNPDKPDQSGENKTDGDKKSGCGSLLNVSAAVPAIITILAGLLCIFNKKERNL